MGRAKVMAAIPEGSGEGERGGDGERIAIAPA
jgi:hypothetical protein